MNIVFCGGDARAGYAGELLTNMGHEVKAWRCPQEVVEILGEERQISIGEMPQGDALVLPTPMTRDGKTVLGTFPALSLEELKKVFPHFGYLFWSAPPPSLLQAVGNLPIRTLDIQKVESFVLTMAHFTAEAALTTLHEHTKKALHGQRIGMLGYGRIGQRLSRMLIALGAEVIVFARGEEKPKLALLDGAKEVYGFPIPKKALANINALVNTIPLPLLSEKDLLALPPNALLLELATGVQFPKSPQRLVVAHGLPGIVLPKSAGAALAEVIHKRLLENQVKQETSL